MESGECFQEQGYVDTVCPTYIIRYEMTWHNVIWYAIWYGIIWCDVRSDVRYMICDMINDTMWQTVRYDIDGLVKDCSNSSVLAVELLQCYTKPSIWYHPMSESFYGNYNVVTMKSLSAYL